MSRKTIKKSTRHSNKNISKIGSYIITGLIVFLMVASIAGVMLYSPQQSGETSYGDLKFSVDKNLNVYVAKINDKTINFNYLPQQTLSVKINFDAINLLRTSKVIGLTFNPTIEDLQFIDYTRFQLQNSIPNIVSGMLYNTTTYDLPIMGCENSSMNFPIIIIKKNPQPAILLNNSCIILQGSGQALLMAKDALLYGYYNVYNDEDIKLLSDNK